MPDIISSLWPFSQHQHWVLHLLPKLWKDVEDEDRPSPQAFYEDFCIRWARAIRSDIVSQMLANASRPAEQSGQSIDTPQGSGRVQSTTLGRDTQPLDSNEDTVMIPIKESSTENEMDDHKEAAKATRSSSGLSIVPCNSINGDFGKGYLHIPAGRGFKAQTIMFNRFQKDKMTAVVDHMAFDHEKFLKILQENRVPTFPLESTTLLYQRGSSSFDMLDECGFECALADWGLAPRISITTGLIPLTATLSAAEPGATGPSRGPSKREIEITSNDEEDQYVPSNALLRFRLRNDARQTASPFS